MVKQIKYLVNKKNKNDFQILSLVILRHFKERESFQKVCKAAWCVV